MRDPLFKTNTETEKEIAFLSTTSDPMAPYLSDYFGRRSGVLLGATIMCGATALQTASQTVGMFIGARSVFSSPYTPLDDACQFTHTSLHVYYRFMIGFGLTFAANAAPMLVSEISYPLYRAPLTSLYNALWYSGSIIAAWATYGTFKINSSWAWRIPSLLQGLPSAIQLILVWFAPESPRFLISKGRDVQALRTLAYYHADGNEYVTLQPL